MTNIDRAIVEALGVHRWKTMGVSSVECECGQIVHGPEGLTEFPADEAFRGHIADALAPLITAAVDAARAEGDKQGAARVREAVEAVLAANERHNVMVETVQLRRRVRKALTEAAPQCQHVYPDGMRCRLADHSAPGLAELHGVTP